MKKKTKKSKKAAAKKPVKKATKKVVAKATKKSAVKASKKSVVKTTTKKVAIKATTKKIAAIDRTPKVKKTEKVGIFGGTFNPIHYGHLNSLELVQKELNLNRVFVVPTAKNPLRDKVEGPRAEHRLEMTKRALPLLNQDPNIEPVFVVKSDEVERGGTSYTIDTLKEFAKENPKSDFYLIIGADQLENFNQWKDYKTVLKLAHLVVTSRPGMTLPTNKKEMPKWLADLLKSFKNQKGSLTTGMKLQFVALNDVDVSATLIRRKIRNNENVSQLTPSVVVDYVKAEGLYKGVENRIGNFKDFTQLCVKLLEEKGGLTILAYDLTQLEQPTEFAIATSGTSTRHAKALAEHITHTIKDLYGVYPQSTEGIQEGRWIVLDYGSLMVHVFYEYVRNEYRIEEIWRQGKVLNLTTPPPAKPVLNK
jgi:nicotinate-nucleotide adenylyltransferase